MKDLIKASYELTDTLGGEANYSWVKLGNVTAKTESGIIRQVKKELGLNNVKCKKEDCGDSIILHPIGYCMVLFINFNY